MSVGAGMKLPNCMKSIHPPMPVSKARTVTMAVSKAVPALFPPWPAVVG